MRAGMRRIFIVVAVVLCVCGSSFGATYLQGVGGDHARSFKHDRFYSGSDKDFHAEAYDFSGVGRGSWLTMISPRYFVSAAHAAPSYGATATFYEGNTTSSGQHQYKVDNWGFQTRYEDGGSYSDLWLGRLTADIPAEDNITYYPVLVLGSESDYIGREIYAYGNPNRVGRNHLDWIYKSYCSGKEGRVMAFDFDEAEGSGMGESECYMMSGDSGGPSFIAWNGELALVGIHWWNYGSSPPYDGKRSGDSFVPYYVDQLNANMEFGQSVTIVPEPTGVTLLVLGALITTVRRRRRRCKT